jgi:hypothetical protein
MHNSNYDAMHEANTVSHRSRPKGAPTLKHTEVVHHMSHGEPMRHRVEAAADCPHCGGEVMADRDSAAGAAT